MNIHLYVYMKNGSQKYSIPVNIYKCNNKLMLVKLKVFWSKIHFLVRISWFLCGSIPPQNTSQTCYVSSCHCIENLWGQLLVLVYQSVPAQVIRYCDHPSNPLSGSPPSSGSNMSYNTRTVITPHYSEILLNPKLQILYMWK